LVSRRLNGEPIAYILGYREFYGLSFKVSPATLIPRPDTETLVETALSKLPQQERVAVLDLGTGSGAIALAIAKHRPLCSVLALDASEAALAVAKNNADRLSIVNANFLQSDWFSELGLQRFELIVSNPPYIEEHDAHLSQGDLRFEPVSALASGKDGLNDIRRIISDCLVYLKPQGWLMLEHGYNQAHAVSALMAEHGLVSVETIQDLSGTDRVTIGRNPLIVSTHWD
jgi:release factor glutamine methyltransferase